MKRLIPCILVAAAALLAPMVATAQTLELTPTLGYRWDGVLSEDSNELFDEDMEIDSSMSFGLHLGVLLSDHSQIELIASRQQSSFGDDLLFDPDPDGVDVDVTYYHIGYLYQWTPGNLRPYVAGSVGMTSLDPDVAGVSREEKFSVSLGGGIKVMASEHVGFRLDGRFFWTDTGSSGHRDWHDWDDCDDDCWELNEELVQHELKVGVVFLF